MIKFSFIGCLALIIYSLYKLEFDIDKIKKKYSIENWQLAFTVFYLGFITFFFAMIHRAYVHSIFYDASAAKYYLMKIKPMYGVKSELFTKDTINYTGFSSSVISRLFDKFGNFNINGKARHIEYERFIEPIYFQELVGRQTYTRLMREDYKQEKKMEKK